MQGTVKWFNNQKGYGFITDSEGKDVFVHHSNIIMDGFRYLNENDIVNFELGTGNDGRQQAVSVIPVLTGKMIKDSLKKKKLRLSETKDKYGETKYIVFNQLDTIMSDKNSMTFLELAKYAGFEIQQISA